MGITSASFFGKSSNPFEEIKNYIKTINEFESYIELINLNSTKENTEHHGFLINYNDYLNLIEKIEKITTKASKQIEENNAEEIAKLDKLKVESINNPYKLISNNNSFIIINETLYNLICDKTESKDCRIKYKVTPDKIVIYSENNQNLEFINNKNNILNKSTIYGIGGINTINLSHHNIPKQNSENQM